MLRWWDGSQWTGHVQPAQPPTPEGQSGGYASASDQQAQAYPPAGGYEPPGGYPPPGGYQQGTGYPPAGGYQQPGGYPPAGGYPQGGGYMQNQGRRWRSRGAIGENTFSKTAIIVSAIYLALALTIHFVLLGIFPFVSAFRAVQRREKLAPIAVVCAVVAVIVGIVGWSHFR